MPAPSAPARERLVCVLRFLAGGGALYAAGVAALLATGAAERTPSPLVGWLVRDAAIVALAAAALVAAVALERGDRSLGLRDVAACALLGVGGAWLVLGLVDMHVFGLIALAHGSLGWDVVFHGSGEAAVIAGALILRARGPWPGPALTTR